MIIAGAKGFAKEVAEVLLQLNHKAPIAFYDDISKDLPQYLFEQYPVLVNIQEAKDFMQQHNNTFVLGTGNPLVRKKMAELLIQAGGKMETVISPFARVGLLGTTIMEGCSIMTGSVITSEVYIATGVLINLNCTIGHNCSIGQFTELSPGVHLSGYVTVGAFTTLGTGAVVLPGINIGQHAVIAAGSVVTKDVPDNVMVAGVPAQVKKGLH